MEKFLNLMLGSQDWPTYAASFVFALIGALISLRIKANKRNKYTKKTPPNFSWKFLLQDNVTRLLNGFWLAFIAFRFSNELLGAEVTMWAAVIIGASTDRIAGLFEKLKNNARK